MKKEELTALGLDDSTATKVAAASAEELKSFIPKTRFDEVNTAKVTLEGTVKTMEGQLEELKKVDAAGLQTKIIELQTANTTAQQKYEADLKVAKLNFALEARLMKEGAVNSKAVMALLDTSKISLDGENLIGADDPIKALKESEKWAFKPTTPPVPGSGGNPPAPPANDKSPTTLLGALKEKFKEGD